MNPTIPHEASQVVEALARGQRQTITHHALKYVYTEGYTAQLPCLRCGTTTEYPQYVFGRDAAGERQILRIQDTGYRMRLTSAGMIVGLSTLFGVFGGAALWYSWMRLVAVVPPLTAWYLANPFPSFLLTAGASVGGCVGIVLVITARGSKLWQVPCRACKQEMVIGFTEHTPHLLSVSALARPWTGA